MLTLRLISHRTPPGLLSDAGGDMTDEKVDTDHEDTVPAELNPPPIVDAEHLFKGTREIWIDLAGVRYRLRITRRNRLILQK